ncbi:ParB/RepB/Spo0J family partition protein [Gordonibacter sp.]|uniref:ParB/RepB/Spo0J family partition protein n=1 Tax=Gordonibacter sp. TaxID=1968902 RepID=UPI002FC7430C
METTKIPLTQCVESKLQNRASLGDVSGLARSIEVNGQITPLIVVADGETYQLVAGHRRTAAMKKLGWEEADAHALRSAVASLGAYMVAAIWVGTLTLG